MVHRAAARGDLRVLRACLAAEPSLVHAPDSHGWTPLDRAAAGFQLPALELLLAAGAHVCGGDDCDDCRSVVHAMASAVQGRLSVLQLLAADAILRRLAAAGMCTTPWTMDLYEHPMRAAYECSNLPMLRLLIKHGGGMAAAAADVNYSLLRGLVRICGERPRLAGGALRLLAELLQHGAPLSEDDGTETEYLLLEAARAAPRVPPKHVAPLLQLLLRHGADPLARDWSVRQTGGLLAGGRAHCCVS